MSKCKYELKPEYEYSEANGYYVWRVGAGYRNEEGRLVKDMLHGSIPVSLADYMFARSVPMNAKYEELFNTIGDPAASKHALMLLIAPDVHNTDISKGPTTWYGAPHSYDDKPAVIRAAGARGWGWYGAASHFEDMPQAIYTDGVQEWWWRGELHRDGDKPAVIHESGMLEWWQHGELRRGFDKSPIYVPCGLAAFLAPLGSELARMFPRLGKALVDEVLRARPSRTTS